MSTSSGSRPSTQRSVRIAVGLASTGVALCFVAALGLVQTPLKAEPAYQTNAPVD